MLFRLLHDHLLLNDEIEIDEIEIDKTLKNAAPEQNKLRSINAKLSHMYTHTHICFLFVIKLQFKIMEST